MFDDPPADPYRRPYVSPSCILRFYIISHYKHQPSEKWRLKIQNLAFFPLSNEFLGPRVDASLIFRVVSYNSQYEIITRRNANMPTQLQGIIPPIVTPFDEAGRIDEATFRNVIRFTIGKGVHGICVGGSTGEGHTYTTEEFVRLMEIAAEEASGRTPLLAGIITNSTKNAVDRAKAIAHLNVAALQITPVHYLFK